MTDEDVVDAIIKSRSNMPRDEIALSVCPSCQSKDIYLVGSYNPLWKCRGCRETFVQPLELLVPKENFEGVRREL